MRAYRNRIRYDNYIVKGLNSNNQNEWFTNEWFTPKVYIDAVTALLGKIDTDPASSELANQTVGAATFYTEKENGFDKPWHGSVFLNPPYGLEDGKSNQARWSSRLINQYESGICTEAVLLVNATTGASWFRPLWSYSICFVDHRIVFINQVGAKNQPVNNSAFVYFGEQNEKFKQVFSQFGQVFIPL